MTYPPPAPRWFQESFRLGRAEGGEFNARARDPYEESMVEELTLRGLRVERQQVIPVSYKGRRLRYPLRVDMRVEGLVLVENKAAVEWNPIFEAQMLTYLRVTRLRLGLVINFGERCVKSGIRRVVNGLPE